MRMRNFLFLNEQVTSEGRQGGMLYDTVSILGKINFNSKIESLS